jgi:CheY-like chemotaxis protein
MPTARATFGLDILLLANERPLAGLLCAGLEDAGHAVDVAHDGEVALDLVRLEPYDLIVLDMSSCSEPLVSRRGSGAPGQAVHHRLRARRPSVPILLLVEGGPNRATSWSSDGRLLDERISKAGLVEIVGQVRRLLRGDRCGRDLLFWPGLAGTRAATATLPC